VTRQVLVGSGKTNIEEDVVMRAEGVVLVLLGENRVVLTVAVMHIVIV
jgi:hypothetical protein